MEDKELNQKGSNDGLVLVKLGGSVITDKTQPFTERMDVIKRLAGEITSARRRFGLRLIVGHGGGSYPHTPAAEFRVHEGRAGGSAPHGVALVQDAAARLNRLVVGALIEAGEDAVSVQPSASVLMDASRIVRWDTRALEAMLEAGLLPVVYGDVVMDMARGWGIVSTEELFLYLAAHLPVGRVVIGSDVDGVLEGVPGDGRKLDVVTPADLDRISSSLGGAGTVDVTGGMRSKVELLLRLAEERGVESVIVNASKRGMLKSALRGEQGIGTLIRPDMAGHHR